MMNFQCGNVSSAVCRVQLAGKLSLLFKYVWYTKVAIFSPSTIVGVRDLKFLLNE